MNKLILEYWDKNNHKLKEYFRTHPQSEYDTYKNLLKITLDLLFDSDLVKSEQVTEVDFGSY